MLNEIEWKSLDFIGYPDYMVSNTGLIKSLKYGKELIRKNVLDSSGYYIINLNNNGIKKKFLVHRLVAMAFIPNPDNKPLIDHINTITTDNNVSNLHWVTPQENNDNPITRMNMLKPTANKKAHEYYLVNREKILAYNRKWKEDNREHYLQQKREYKKRIRESA